MLTEAHEHALITIYGDTPDKDIAKAVNACLLDMEVKILTPLTRENLEQAAQNSAVVLIGIKSADDPHITVGRALQDNRNIVADVVAFCVDGFRTTPIQIMGRGFDLCLSLEDSQVTEFKKFFQQKIITGNRRLAGLIQEEEYRRVCDALSNAPASMIVFDADKRAVFVSDHYFRAYPKIAPRLIRGLSVYDSFSMMMKEEGIAPEDPRYAKLQKFWHNLEGSIEFTLDTGTSYRLKAVRLPNRRGTVVMAQNISDYNYRKSELEKRSEELRDELEKHKNSSHHLEAIKIDIKQAILAFEQETDTGTHHEEISALKQILKKIQEISNA